MTDKITTEEAIKRLEKSIACMESGYTCSFNPIDGCKSCESYVADEKTIEATEVAIEALEQNEKLKAVIKGWYGQNGIVGVDEEVNAVSCEHCTRRIDGKCPLPDDLDEVCPQSDDEAVELFFKYGLG